MPVIKIYGILDSSSKRGMFSLYKYSELTKQLKKSVEAIKSLSLSRDDVTVIFCPGEVFPDDIIVEVCGLFETPERTLSVRKAFADKVQSILDKFVNLPEYKTKRLIEVFVHTFNPESGFSSNRVK